MNTPSQHTTVKRDQTNGGKAMLNVGDPAPDFNALNHAGNEVRLSDLRGSKVWLWFFSSPGGGN